MKNSSSSNLLKAKIRVFFFRHQRQYHTLWNWCKEIKNFQTTVVHKAFRRLYQSRFYSLNRTGSHNIAEHQHKKKQKASLVWMWMSWYNVDKPNQILSRLVKHHHFLLYILYFCNSGCLVWLISVYFNHIYYHRMVTMQFFFMLFVIMTGLILFLSSLWISLFTGLNILSYGYSKVQCLHQMINF
jgi:hypothetical protein